MDIRVGDYVSLSEEVKNREWEPKVRHLRGEYLVTKIEGEYIIFKTGEIFLVDGTRRWHKKHLKLISNWENV